MNLKKLGRHYQSEYITRMLTDFALDMINTTKEIVIINIGTDRCIGDSVGPLVGTLLKNYDTHFYVYGTIDEPIHALNLQGRLTKIKQDHPNAFIIGIDACLGDSDTVGEVQIRNRPIYPGKGVGKTLPEVGNISIIGITDTCDNNELFTNRNIRLSLVCGIASEIAKILLEIDKQIHNKNKYTFIHSEQIALTV